MNEFWWISAHLRALGQAPSRVPTSGPMCLTPAWGKHLAQGRPSIDHVTFADAAKCQPQTVSQSQEGSVGGPTTTWCMHPLASFLTQLLLELPIILLGCTPPAGSSSPSDSEDDEQADNVRTIVADFSSVSVLGRELTPCSASTDASLARSSPI